MKLDFKDKKCLVKIAGIHKIVKKPMLLVIKVNKSFPTTLQKYFEETC